VSEAIVERHCGSHLIYSTSQNSAHNKREDQCIARHTDINRGTASYPTDKPGHLTIAETQKGKKSGAIGHDPMGILSNNSSRTAYYPVPQTEAAVPVIHCLRGSSIDKNEYIGFVPASRQPRQAIAAMKST